MKHKISSTRCIRTWASASLCAPDVRPLSSLTRNHISLRNAETILLLKAPIHRPCSRHSRSITSITQPRSAAVLEAASLPPETPFLAALLAEVYPNAPEVLFTKPWSREGWSVVLPKRKPTATISSKTEPNSDGLPEHHVSCAYTLKVPGGNKYRVEHEAATRTEAVQVAASQLILALHRDGALQQIIDRRKENALLSEQEDNDESHFEAKTFVNLQDHPAPKGKITKDEVIGQSEAENVVEIEGKEGGQASKDPESGVFPLKLTATTQMISLMSSVSRDILRVPIDSTNNSTFVDAGVYNQPMYFPRLKTSKKKLKARDRRLLEQHEALQSDPSLAGLREQKDALPMSEVRDEILDMINKNPFTIVVGSTGSGKTTQVPQILFEDAILRGEGSTAEIVCTQPRRIAARSAAKRVAFERNERLRDTVGYHVKDDANLPIGSGAITFCTTGILLQRLRFNPEHTMDTLSHIIVDEVHERDMFVDFLMITLKDTVKARLEAGKRTPKVIIMSATLDLELFSNYFSQEAGDGSKVRCPSIVVPGRSFPVSEVYLDEIVPAIQSYQKGYYLDSMLEELPVARFLVEEGVLSVESLPDHMRKKLQSDEKAYQLRIKRKADKNAIAFIQGIKETIKGQLLLVAATIAHIAKTTTAGAILTFLPGIGEIVEVHKALQQHPLGVNIGNSSKYKIIMLHSALPDLQDDVFDEPDKGCRKIILATNIAETSITIPDVKYVVDAGKSKEPAYDQLTGITQTAAEWVSKPSTKQRAGRAGRVSDGHYFAVFSKQRHESLRASVLPEILRSDLQQICLDIKTQICTDSTDINEVLSKAIEPPNPDAVKAAIQDLQDLEALTEDEIITPLGMFLASLPIHPAMGKLVVLGIIFRCFDAMLLLAAAKNHQLTVRPPFLETEADASKLQFANGTNADPVALMNQFRWARSQQGRRDFRQVMTEKFLSRREFGSIDQTMIEVEDILVEAGIIQDTLDEERVQYQCGPPDLNRNSNHLPLIKALTLAANRKKLAVRRSVPANAEQKSQGWERSYNWQDMSIGQDKTLAKIYPSSVNAIRSVPPDQRDLRETTLSGVYSYGAGVKGLNDMLMLRDVTQSSPLTAALFGCKVVSSLSDKEEPQLIVNDWLPINMNASDKAGAVAAIVKFREAADKIQAATFSGILNRANCGDDSGYLEDDPLREKFVSVLIDVLELDPRDETVRPLLTQENLLSAMDRHINQDLKNEGLGGG